MIHKARKKAGKNNCAVFGIGTDSYDFYFLAIDNNSVWSFRYVRWYAGDEQVKVEIVSRIAKIIREGAGLVPDSTAFWSGSGSGVATGTGTGPATGVAASLASVSSRTGCVIRDVEANGDAEEGGEDAEEIW
jgi:hypothetical protein